jgi:Family of unknown function (DUF5694)
MLKAAATLIAASLSLPAIAAPEKPIEVMVLGAYHFGNPGQDVHNMKVDSVLVPKRQAELDAVARALLTFRPTRVMVEATSDAPGFAYDRYAAFTSATLLEKADERVQIGFRVAKMAGLKTVEAIDEQPSEGEPDYFPYDTLTAAATKFGQKPIMEAADAPLTARLKAFEADQKTHSVGQMLMRQNDASEVKADSGWYYKMLAIGDVNTQAGADLNAMWYLRNAKIFAKLMQVAKPGDRVLVIYGGGHSYWLRHFASETPGYRFVDPVPFLAKAH